MGEHRCDSCDICRARTKRDRADIAFRLACACNCDVEDLDPAALALAMPDYLTVDQAAHFMPGLRGVRIERQAPIADYYDGADTTALCLDAKTVTFSPPPGPITFAVPYDDIERNREP